jgi:hypothetical protein
MKAFGVKIALAPWILIFPISGRVHQEVWDDHSGMIQAQTVTQFMGEGPRPPIKLIKENQRRIARWGSFACCAIVITADIRFSFEPEDRGRVSTRSNIIQVIDDFAALNMCKLYGRYFPDEFSWREARSVIRKIIERTSKTFPIHMVMHSQVAFGRYDFADGVLKLADKDIFKNVGIFNLASPPYGDCANVQLGALPDRYTLRLTNPISLSAIPLGEASAYKVINRMKQEKNKERQVYISFFIKLNDFISNYSQVEKTKILSTEARGTLISLRFFADQARTTLIYDYVPPVILGPTE